MKRWLQHNSVAIVGFVGAAMVVLSSMGTCGCATNWELVAIKSLAAAERTVLIGQEELPHVDKAKHAEIVAAAKDKDSGLRALEAWEAKRNVMAQAIDGAHAVIVTARDGIKDIQSGVADPKNAGKWISTALDGARNMLAVLAAVGIKIPGVFP